MWDVCWGRNGEVVYGGEGGWCTFSLTFPAPYKRTPESRAALRHLQRLPQMFCRLRGAASVFDYQLANANFLGHFSAPAFLQGQLQAFWNRKVQLHPICRTARHTGSQMGAIFPLRTDRKSGHKDKRNSSLPLGGEEFFFRVFSLGSQKA